MQTTTVQKYTEIVERLMPGANIIKLIGYAKGNDNYNEAKKPIGRWQNTKTMNDKQINKWLDQGGWIGATIPKDRYLIDIDTANEGELLKDLLEGENVHHHLIRTPNGYQFIFKESNGLTQYQKYVNRLGLTQDTRKAEAGYIVFPTHNTENRHVLTESIDQLSEPPNYLKRVWNAEKQPSPMAYPYKSEGSRNGDFYDLARRLMTCGVSKEDVQESLSLAYKYFVIDKNDFTLNEVMKSIESASNKVNDGKQEFQISYKSERNIVIPDPYRIGKNNMLLFDKEDKDGNITSIVISRKTPFLTKEFHNIEFPQVFYEIEWKEPHKTVKEVVPASTIAVRKELLELSNMGFSVNDNNASDLIRFLDTFLSYNNLEVFHAVERLGNVKDKFIHPVLSEDVEIIALDYGEKQLLESFEVNGTVEGWKKEVFERIKDSPIAVFMVLSSFASIVLNDLNIDPFIVDLSGTTSQGKTTTLDVASSVWGNKRLVNEWNATRVAIERKAAYLNSFPLLMDDTRKADERALKDIVYQYSGGRSKGRGSIKGSQKEYTWNNILLSTGEVSLNEYAKEQGGAAARIIPLNGQPLKKDLDNLIKLKEGMENNYGVMGIEFLKVWLKHKDDFISEYHKFRNHYVEKSNGYEVLSRIAGYYASVHFVGSILKDRLGLDIDLKAISTLFDEIAEENKDIDKPMQFLERILIDLDSKRDGIFYHYVPEKQMTKAIYKKNKRQLYLTPAYTDEFLGAEENQTRKEWLKREITIPVVNRSGKKVDYNFISHKGKKLRAIALNMDIVQELGFDFHENEASQDFDES